MRSEVAIFLTLTKPLTSGKSHSISINTGGNTEYKVVKIIQFGPIMVPGLFGLKILHGFY